MIYKKNYKAISVPFASSMYTFCDDVRENAFKVLLLVVLLCAFFPSFAQIKVDVLATAKNDSVFISYNIGDTVSSRLYDVYLLARTDTGSFELTEVTGDYGKNISVGKHEVVWDALKQLERFDGKIQLEVKAIPQFNFLSPKRDQRVTRGNPITFSWYGGNSTEDQLLVQLYQYDKLLEDTLGIITNQASYTWQVPAKTKPGGGYRIRIIGTKKTDLKAFSLPVAVDARIPKTYKYIAAGTGVAGLGILIAQLLRILPPPFGPDE